MSTSLEEQIQQLKSIITEMESQRAVLGEKALEEALVPFRQKLAELEAHIDTPELVSTESPARQRKLITLLFMDVVGSTEMTRHLDPEDTMEIMDSALQRLAVPVRSHGGRVTRFMGDGFKAIFGDPVARENDPEQAVRAGLDILEVSRSLAQELESHWHIQRFNVRIGINSGLVALGGYTEAEDTVMGIPVNLAARLESAAPPGCLLISHHTYRHVRGVFTVEPQKPINAKGFPEPVPVYLVKEIKPRAYRVQTRGVEGVETQMVGRNDELRFLQDALMSAFEEGEGHIVTVSGDAGVGKSRLLYEFQNWLELLPSSQAVRFFQGRARQESQGSPYSLLRDVFAFRFQILDDDTGEQARQKIELGFTEEFADDEDTVMKAHIIGQLLGFDFSASPHLKGVLNDAEQLLNRGLMYLNQYFQTLLQEIPVVIFLEDIHWADDSSLDIVSQFGKRAVELPILIVFATRLTLFERRPYWGEGQDYHTILELRPLSKRASRQLVAEILKLANDVPTELRELVVRGAEGNPFYTEELIKMLIENDVVIPNEGTWNIDLTRLEEMDVPSTLAGVLQARLDSVPIHERTVLQQASVVGRLFWDSIVTYIQAEGGNAADPQLIPQALSSLRNRELIHRHEESVFAGSVEYIFKHDVLREVTYESVIKRLRKNYHGYVADWLIENCSDRIEEYSGLIAQHLLLAGRSESAGEYFLQAGEAALYSYANEGAKSFFHQALELSPQGQLQADILSGLGESLSRQGDSEGAIRSWQKAIKLYRALEDSSNLGEVYAQLSKLLWHSDQVQAWNICQEGLKYLKGAADSPGYARLLAEAGRMALFRAETDQVMPLSQKAFEMAQRLDDIEVIVDTKITIAIHVDDIKERISTLEEAIELAKANQLLRAEARAHINLSNYMVQVDLPSTIEHLIKGAKIAKLISDRGMLMFALSMLAIYYPELGELNSLDDKFRDFLPHTIKSNSTEFEFWLEVNRQLMIKRGQWKPALEASRKKVDAFRESNKIQEISTTNGELVRIIMEMNRFGQQDDLTEAERALQENHEYGFLRRYEPPAMVILYARLGQFDQAHEWLAKASEDEIYDEYDLYLLDLISNAEFELAYAEGRWSNAIEKSALASKTYQESGRIWNMARELINLGDALFGRDETGDLDQARETYQQSLDMFTEMDAPGYIEVLEERLEKLKD